MFALPSHRPGLEEKQDVATYDGAHRVARGIVRVIYKGLFVGVLLPREVQESALLVIRVEHNRQLAMDGRAAGAWDRRIELNRWRDSTLRVLLRTDAERRAFDANSERLRPQGRPPR